MITLIQAYVITGLLSAIVFIIVTHNEDFDEYHLLNHKKVYSQKAKIASAVSLIILWPYAVYTVYKEHKGG